MTKKASSSTTFGDESVESTETAPVETVTEESTDDAVGDVDAPEPKYSNDNAGAEAEDRDNLAAETTPAPEADETPEAPKDAEVGEAPEGTEPDSVIVPIGGWNEYEAKLRDDLDGFIVGRQIESAVRYAKGAWDAAKASQ